MLLYDILYLIKRATQISCHMGTTKIWVLCLVTQHLSTTIFSVYNVLKSTMGNPDKVYADLCRLHCHFADLLYLFPSK